jgi:hypothetical protein
MGEEAVMPELGTGTRIQEDYVKSEYRPSRIELLRYHQINIRFLSIGCVVEVGCKSVPFSTVKEGMDALYDYIANPYEVTKIWEERFSKEEEL